MTSAPPAAPYGASTCLTLLLLACVSCESASGKPRLVVAAAASLTGAAPELARLHGGDIDLRLDATSHLARQLADGAGFDVFITADERWMDWATQRQLVDGDAVVHVASGRLVLIAGDAASPPWGRIAVASENVPAGRYAREALARAGRLDALQDRLVNSRHVRQALALVRTREVDAAIVYASDLHGLSDLRVVEVLTADVRYFAAPVQSSPRSAAASRFVSELGSPRASAIWSRFGFTPGRMPVDKEGS